MLCLALSLTLLVAALPTHAQSPDASKALASVGADAVHVVTTRTVFDTKALLNETGKLLATNGKWSISKQAPAACPQTTETCVQVLYVVPDTNRTCEWTVLLTGDGSSGKILEENADAARFFLTRLSTEEAAALVETRKAPVYPPIAKAAHQAGQVELSFVITAEGKVSNLAIVSGPVMLQGASIEAMKEWSFKPLKIGEHTVPWTAHLIFTFKYQNGSVTDSFNAPR